MYFVVFSFASPEYNINNFTSDWQSGKAIAALAEAVLPGQMNLPNDFSNNPVRDAEMGITKARENMNIPSIIDAEDMVNTPDELSNMTYVVVVVVGCWLLVVGCWLFYYH
jgi:hypothetical protein